MTAKRFKSPEGKRLLHEDYNRLLTLWGVANEEKDISTKYGKTHVIISGNRVNPPLLLVHGTGDNSAISWLSNIQELAKYFYVVTIDTFAGTGKSEPNDNYSKEFDPALWLDNILSAMHINITNLAGISYGVNLILSYAIKYPKRVNKIVCLSGYVPVKGIKTYLIILRALKFFFPEILFLTEKNATRLLKKMSGPNYNLILNKDVINHWLLTLKHSNPKRQKIFLYDNKLISTFRDKAIFLTGEFDKLAHHQSAIQSFKDNNLCYRIVKNVGHIMNLEQPDLINREVIKYILQ